VFNPLEWILDSRASHHIISNFQALTNLEKLPEVINITTLTSYIVAVGEAGTVYLLHGLILKNVLYSPFFNCNLISIQQLTTYENCIITCEIQFYLI